MHVEHATNDFIQPNRFSLPAGLDFHEIHLTRRHSLSTATLAPLSRDRVTFAELGPARAPAPHPPAVSLAPIALMSDAGGGQRSVSAPPSQSAAATEFTKLSAEFFYDREFVLGFGNLHRFGGVNKA